MSARIVPDYRALAREVAASRSGKRLALANGCFDLLHVGHVRLLAEARRHADLLVVALNSDSSARALKGEGRPYVPLTERLEVVAALADVDWVTSFGELTAGPLIEVLRPELQIKGTDRDPALVPEREQVEAYGGRILICGDPKTRSSTALGGRRRG